jgi:site-specific DNA recombinase
MPSTNGHGPKRAILYARVSTDEQARTGYSLAQQLEAVREYAAQEGYEILEEITDEGHSGASLARPGLDYVRDLVAAGGVSVVLAQDRDRFSRKVVLNGLLEEELTKYGCKTKALNDYGDDSPEGALMRGIQTQFAEYERAKIAERTRRGKERKAREGRILRGRKPPYGFRYNAAGDGLMIHEPEMAVVGRIYRMAAESLGPQAIQTRLFEEGTPSPTGDVLWPRQTVERVLWSDLYKAHTHDELSGMVSAEVLVRLDEGSEYGVWWFGRRSTTEHSVSEPDGNGGRRYRKATTTRIRPIEERTAVPVPAYLPRSLVDQARATLAANRPPERKRLARQWELRGLLRCSCGWRMSTHTTSSSGRSTDYHYYVCKQRKRRKQACGCTQRGVKATEAESAVWEFISDLLRDPEHVRRGMERLIEQERLERARDPEHEAEVWAQKIAECDRKRGAYQDQQAAGLMTLEELGSKLRELDNTRRTAERELATLRGRRQRVEELEQDRDTLLESMVEMVPEALDALTGEEKNRIYRMLRLEVTPSTEGYEVSGALCTSATPLAPARDPAPPAP